MSKFSLAYNKKGFVQSKNNLDHEDPEFEDLGEDQIPQINLFPEGVMKRKPSIRNWSMYTSPYKNQDWDLNFQFKKENPFWEFGKKGKILNKVRNTKMKPNSLSPKSGNSKKNFLADTNKVLKEIQEPQNRMRNISISSNSIMPQVLIQAKNRKFEILKQDQFDTLHNLTTKNKCFDEDSPSRGSRASNIYSRCETPYFKNEKVRKTSSPSSI